RTRLASKRRCDPPVAEQPGIVRRADDRRPALGLRGRLRGFAHQTYEVTGLQRRLLRRELGIVGDLRAEVAATVGDAPEAQATGEVLFVELEIRVLAGITMIAAPHLQRRARIADKRDGRAVAAA